MQNWKCKICLGLNNEKKENVKIWLIWFFFFYQSFTDCFNSFKNLARNFVNKFESRTKISKSCMNYLKCVFSDVKYIWSKKGQKVNIDGRKFRLGFLPKQNKIETKEWNLSQCSSVYFSSFFQFHFIDFSF